MAKQEKGDVGENTGESTRAAIRRALTRGQTLESIGKATGRDGSTISSILGGKIANPPKGLAAKIRALPAIKTEEGGETPTGSKATAAFKKHR